MSVAAPDPASLPHGRGRLVPSLAPILIFDVIGPLAVYYLLRSIGLSTVAALVLSGVVPAIGIALGVIRNRRVDAFGVLVLIGIAVGVVLGLVSRNARLVLLEGTVPTAVFGVVCLGSLWAKRPLMLRFAVESMGADSPRGREFASLWRFPVFRHTFRVITVVWGLAFLAEAGAQAIIVQTASASVAKTTSNLLPLAVFAIVAAWNVSYGRRSKRSGERAAAIAQAGGDVPPAIPV